MNSQKTFLIENSSSLAERLTQARFTSQVAPECARWMIYGDSLTPEVFEQLDRHTGCSNQAIRSWTVGRYDVVLMAGDLTTLHQQSLQQMGVDYAGTAHIPNLKNPGLVLLDMDSTAIEIECIDEIAKLAGVGDEVIAVTERAMRGELNFEQSLRQRVSKLAGADASILEQVRQKLPLTSELQLLIATFQSFGWKTAIASGGFTYFSDDLKTRLNLDFAQSNTLEIVQGQLTGRVLGDIVGAQKKADILTHLMQEYHIAPENTVAIGDGANDLVMMDTAGLGIAYHAKPKVEALAQAAIRVSALGGVMCILSAGLMMH
jgi:phosphoserine phosphatase